LNKIIPDTLFIGQNIIYMPKCHSTNQVALDLNLELPAQEGSIVITSHQTAGRGQRGNSWEASPHENLTFSVILSPTFLKIDEQFSLSMAVAISIYDFLSLYVPEGLRIKWPNDILYQHKKIGGILIENLIRKNGMEKSVVGMGININQSYFAESKAISLQNITQQVYELEILLKQFCEKFEEKYLLLKTEHFQEIKENYLSKLFAYQSACLYDYHGTLMRGKIVDVAFSGLLSMENEGKIYQYDFKEISFLL
jgi:BirA family transcriptional regulator, biotin operon repressor / biotin---[acetyl-CoA-carboxylase] ligase